MSKAFPTFNAGVLILPAGPEAAPPTAAQFRDPAEESPLISRDPRVLFPALRLSPLCQDL